MKKQIEQFLANRLASAPPPEIPGQVLVLLIGEEACACRQTLAQHLEIIWGLTGQRVIYHEFSGNPDLNAPGDLARLNQEIDDLAYSVSGPGSVTLCGLVWAEDPLAEYAADLIHLVGNWLQATADLGWLPMLTVMLPRYNRGTDRQTAGVFRLAKKILAHRVLPLMYPFYADSNASPEEIPWEDRFRVYFMDCLSADQRNGCLEDMVYLLNHQTPGVFLPAFHETPKILTHHIALQIHSCLESSAPEQTGAANIHPDTLIRNYVTQVEAPESAFRKWMGHACLFRKAPTAGNLSTRMLYGSWLQDLAQTWRERLLNRPVPEEILNSWLEDLGEEALELCQKQLAIQAPPVPFRADSRSLDFEVPAFERWEQLLNQEVEHACRVFYPDALEHRCHQLSQAFLALVNAKLGLLSRAPAPDRARLLEQLSTLICQSQPAERFVPRAMNDSQLIRLNQSLSAVLHASQPDYTPLLELAMELIGPLGEPSDDRSAYWHCCKFHYLGSLFNQYTPGCRLWTGSRQGHRIYTIRLDGDSVLGISDLMYFYRNAERMKKIEVTL